MDFVKIFHYGLHWNSHFSLWGPELELWINYGNFEVTVQEEDCVYE